jgi:hypothetical protein
MSYSNYIKAIGLVEKCEGYESGTGKPDSVIKKAENLLGVHFSKQLYHYFSNYGYIEFFGAEIYGIVKDDFSGIPSGACVETALIDRKRYALPLAWMPIYDFGDGNMAYLNFDDKNEDEEPPIIMAIYTGKTYEIRHQVASDFGDFLLVLVERQVAQQ